MWRCLSEKWNWRDRGFMAKSGHDILSILSSSKAGNGQEGRKKEKERGRRRKEKGERRQWYDYHCLG
jgi:hypothetical protein